MVPMNFNVLKEVPEVCRVRFHLTADNNIHYYMMKEFQGFLNVQFEEVPGVHNEVLEFVSDVKPAAPSMGSNELRTH